jgi:hypothetical protein
MIGNPRFGAVGMLALPFFLLFELLGPVVEVLGLVSVVLAAALDILDVGTALLMVTLALAVGTLVSTTTVAVEEFTYHRYRRSRDVLALLAAGVLENIGFRQAHAWFRLRGLLAALTRRKPVWTAMPRTGFAGVASLEAAPTSASA